MAKRTSKVARAATSATSAPDTQMAAGIEQRVLAFAKQVGYVAGTIQMKTEGWTDREALRKQLASVRDGATHLLEQLGTAAGRTLRRKPAAQPPRKTTRARSGGVVDAPGKTHRKQAPADPDARLARSQAAKRRAAMPREKTSRRRARG